MRSNGCGVRSNRLRPRSDWRLELSIVHFGFGLPIVRQLLRWLFVPCARENRCRSNVRWQHRQLHCRTLYEQDCPVHVRAVRNRRLTNDTADATHRHSTRTGRLSLRCCARAARSMAQVLGRFSSWLDSGAVSQVCRESHANTSGELHFRSTLDNAASATYDRSVETRSR